MYLKKEYINESVKKDFAEKYHAEFAWAYYHKTKDIEDVELGVITFEHNGIPHKRAIIKQKKNDINENKFVDKFIDIGGNKQDMTSSYLINPNYQYNKNEFTNVMFTSLNKETFENKFGNLNDDKIKEANNLMSHFCNLKDEGVIYSKDGEAFQYKIIENSDMTLGSYLLLDELRIYKDNIQIGYLKTKYTSDVIINELLGKDYTIQTGDNLTPEHKIDYLKDKGITHNDSNYDIVFNLTKTQLQNEYKKIKKELKVFNEIATVDYSKISENYKGRGLGTQMYLKIAQHYENKNIMFRSSSLQSPSAKGLWQKIKKEYPNMIKEINIDEQTYYSLSIKEPNNKLQTKRKNKKTL